MPPNMDKSTMVVEDKGKDGDIIIVGCIFPPRVKNMRGIPVDEEVDGVKFIRLNLGVEEDMQRRVDLVVHKLAQTVCLARRGDIAAKSQLDTVFKYQALHPETPFVDKLDNMYRVLDRKDFIYDLERLAKETGTFKCPKFVVVDSDNVALRDVVHRNTLAFPLICKTIEACSTVESHMIHIVTKEEDLKMLKTPIVLQNYMNHGGKLFKCYMAGKNFTFIKRKSVADIIPGLGRSLTFDSQEAFPDFEMLNGVPENAVDCLTPAIDEMELEKECHQIAKHIQGEFGLQFFGFDVIVESATTDIYVVDLNYFPSYKEKSDYVVGWIRDIALDIVKAKRQQR